MKLSKDPRSVIMLLDQAFGALRLVPEEKGISTIVGIDLMPAAARALEQLSELDVQVILLAPGPLSDDALQNLKHFLPSIDRVVVCDQGLSKALSACAEHLSSRAEALFVAADRMLRGQAVRQGFAAVPHPLVAALMVRGCSLQFARLTGEREHFAQIPETIPYFVERTESGSWSLLAIMSRAAIAEAVTRQLGIEILPLDIATEDPLFAQLDETDERVTEELSKRKVLFADGRRALVALGPSEFNDSMAVYGPHGRFEFLMPSPHLLQPAPDSSTAFQKARLALGRWPLERIEKAPMAAIDTDILDLILAPCPSTAASLQADVDRYSGASPLDSSGSIVSRHIQHPDNSRAVQALLDELNAMGYCAHTHSFSFAGTTLNNVIADLPGTGYFIIHPDILERLREILLRHPLPDPPDPWMKAIMRVVGDEWLEEQQLEELSPSRRRIAIERIFELRPWFPWWLRFCPLPGLGAELVIVGCHLDSTAARDAGYNPLTDPAPGADDDASGIAATLAIARYLSNFRGKLPHTVRFCFFNAEESGLVGSKAYAAALKAAGAPVRAVVCMDMIGYNSDVAQIFEVHAGYTDPAVRDANVPIANTIAAWTASLGALAPVQIYKGTSSAGGADRDLYDGAINRSDHAAFHQQGYPAVVVSEDFFVNLATEPGADPNPNYHTGSDTVIDSAFASDITCAVAFAVKELAGG